MKDLKTNAVTELGIWLPGGSVNQVQVNSKSEDSDQNHILSAGALVAAGQKPLRFRCEADDRQTGDRCGIEAARSTVRWSPIGNHFHFGFVLGMLPLSGKAG